jgi:hypothetical protein
MLEKFTQKLQKADSSDLYEITLKSSLIKNGEILIYELGEMADLFSKDKAEQIRDNFVKNNIKIRQITNNSKLDKFSDSQEYVNNTIKFRYVPKDIFNIENEILIFNDTVAIYNTKELLVIEDAKFANNQRQLFENVWEQGQSPALNFTYIPNHSFYNSFDIFIGDKQVIVWPDADAKTSYAGYTKKDVEKYINNIVVADPYYNDATYLIAFIWSYNGEKMADIWKFNNNHVDDRSGPLSDVRVYREGLQCNNLGLASGNTLLVLGYEEKLRRQSKNIKEYLSGPLPKLPLEIMNSVDFF